MRVKNFNDPVNKSNGKRTTLYEMSGGGGTINPATNETLGGVIIGDGIAVDESGKISVPGGGGGGFGDRIIGTSAEDGMIVHNDSKTFDKDGFLVMTGNSESVYHITNSNAIVYNFNPYFTATFTGNSTEVYFYPVKSGDTLRFVRTSGNGNIAYGFLPLK